MKTILVVDDTYVNRLLMKEIIKTIGVYEIIEADNGVDAIYKVENNNIDLIFMDIQMPRLGGVEATNHIRATIHEHIPIVGISAYDNYSNMIQCGNKSFNDFYAKPVSPETIKLVLDKYLKE